MRNIAIKQALLFPLGAMVALMLVGLTVSGYSSISQQLSELGPLGGYPSVFESVLAVIVGASIIIFSLALVRHPSGEFAFTVFTSLLFGISMLCNGIFPMGSPLHGLYGIGFFSVLTPVLFVAELHPSKRTKAISAVSKCVAVITLFYLWLTITRFDPNGFHGLTQRLAVIPMFGWYSYASYMLMSGHKATRKETAMNNADFVADSAG
nr:hypothetical protein [uncultured bacterium]